MLDQRSSDLEKGRWTLMIVVFPGHKLGRWRVFKAVSTGATGSGLAQHQATLEGRWKLELSWALGASTPESGPDRRTVLGWRASWAAGRASGRATPWRLSAQNLLFNLLLNYLLEVILGVLPGVDRATDPAYRLLGKVAFALCASRALVEEALGAVVIAHNLADHARVGWLDLLAHPGELVPDRRLLASSL